jgi:hypothetical protein
MVRHLPPGEMIDDAERRRRVLETLKEWGVAHEDQEIFGERSTELSPLS